MAIDEKYGIPTGYNNKLIQEYLQSATSASQAKQQAAQNTLDTSNSMMYDALGRMQLQTERDIAQRRIQAQRTGMTSSQLAAMEMQNIMVGQLGAQQIAQQYRQEQALLEQEYAGGEDALRAGLFEILNQNAGQVAAVDTQKYSSSGISQIQELFPDAPRDVQLALTQKFMGFELDSKDQKLIKEYMKKDKGTGSEKPLSFEEFSLAVGATGSSTEPIASQYQTYLANFGK